MMDAATTQIVFLLERYSSLEYFAQLVRNWEDFVSFNEKCVARFSANLPLDIRNRPLPEQGDVVWDSIVLPNFRRTREALLNAYQKVSHGDLTALGVAHSVMNDAKGQQDYDFEWMTPNEQDEYADLLSKAQKKARNIVNTEENTWNPGDLSVCYYASGRGPLNLPEILPTYRINHKISTRTGMSVPQPGVYLPELEHCEPRFLTTRKPAAPYASVLVSFDERRAADGSVIEREPVVTKSECVWHLVERVEHSGNAKEPSIAEDFLRVPAHARCPRPGYYFSPAKADSRQKFSLGELMPELGSAYGATIWQWDQNQ